MSPPTSFAFALSFSFPPPDSLVGSGRGPGIAFLPIPLRNIAAGYAHANLIDLIVESFSGVSTYS